jgi:hypothetical protein
MMQNSSESEREQQSGSPQPPSVVGVCSSKISLRISCLPSSREIWQFLQGQYLPMGLSSGILERSDAATIHRLLL